MERVETVVVDNKKYKVEFYYEFPSLVDNYAGGYEIYSINDKPEYDYEDTLVEEIINELEELRIKQGD